MINSNFSFDKQSAERAEKLALYYMVTNWVNRIELELDENHAYKQHFINVDIWAKRKEKDA